MIYLTETIFSDSIMVIPDKLQIRNLVLIGNLAVTININLALYKLTKYGAIEL